MAKTTSDSILGVIRKESWILDQFEIFVNIAFSGHKGNRCQTEYGAATWRTTWPWRRSAGSDCFLVNVGICCSVVQGALSSFCGARNMQPHCTACHNHHHHHHHCQHHRQLPHPASNPSIRSSSSAAAAAAVHHASDAVAFTPLVAEVDPDAAFSPLVVESSLPDSHPPWRPTYLMHTIYDYFIHLLHGLYAHLVIFGYNCEEL